MDFGKEVASEVLIAGNSSFFGNKKCHLKYLLVLFVSCENKSSKLQLGS